MSFGLDGQGVPSPVRASDDLDTVLAAVREADEGFQGLYDSIDVSLPGDSDDVETSVATVEGVDGDIITLHVIRPSGVTGPLPGVVYLHGGGMAILSADNPVHRRWCMDIAQAGAVAVMVDFRNASRGEEHHPFPTGVEDCLKAVTWVHEQREALGLSTVVLQGESGGGNLAIATALLAKRRGIEAIDGVYASVPYISGGYVWARERKLAELPSMIENDGYFVLCEQMGLLVRAYDPTGEYADDPIAWPYHASEEELRGLPPFVISVNELDPLRDEGIAFARRLARAGVPVASHVNLGLIHGAELIFRHWVGPSTRAAVASIVGFARDRARLAART
ncbi:alpha/beta hydrolase fold domain-containing protein [Aeromicrobium endophyticum]|uniref:alpha/beta hydrolase fold domain-containing protein n=1 Tax=Aeromicrobium endophyticum TaxID=2292704 RepID=UPI0013145939|nr:alpha/beta hydrolase fold domain-containing protein [Aeromicrobium endophyticum]